MISRRQMLAAAGSSLLVPQFASAVEPSSHFDRLWQHHPMGDARRRGERWPCANVLNIDCLSDPSDLTRDQCSVRLGVALKGAFPQLTLNDFPVLKDDEQGESAKYPLVCTNLTRRECAHSEDELHFLRTSELASCLLSISDGAAGRRHPKFDWLCTHETYDRTNGAIARFRSLIGNRNGLIFIENFWDRRYGAMHGSHIDLWHGGMRWTKNELFYRGSDNPDLRYEDVADRILFWPVRDG